MKYLFLSLLVGCIWSKSIAQENLFFLSATPVDDPYIYQHHFTASLLQYNPDSLLINAVMSLADDDNRIYDIRYYTDNKVIILGYETKKFIRHLTVIKTDNPLNVISNFNKPVINYDLLNYNLIKRNDTINLCIKWVNPNLEKYKYYQGFNLFDFTDRELFSEDFKQVILSGTDFFMNLQIDYQPVYTGVADGYLRLPLTRDIEDRPLFPLTLPDSLQLRAKKMVQIVINNDHHFILRTNTNHYIKNSNIGSNNLIIFNKKSQQWNRKEVKGNILNIRSFDDWIIGVVYMDVSPVFKESPSASNEDTLNLKNEYNAKTRFKFLEIYSPGTLYMYNTYTNTYIEWETKQGDSEILLVNTNEVYYRVNDEIYIVPIIDGIKLGKSRLLVKDIRVPQIHWAFFGE